jgi:two-component system sensor histidine kinase UhpB
VASSDKARLGRSGRKRYRSLRRRLILDSAVLIVAACGLTALILAPKKFTSVELEEALVMVVVLGSLAMINVLRVSRVLAPLQTLTALAREVDLETPGQGIPDARPTSEVGELAVAFNEMLARLELERREATRRVLAAHESERLHVAQELHDEVGQTLTAVLLALSRLDAHLPDDMRGELGEAQDATRRSIEDIRRIATDLRPEALNDLGLAGALGALGEGFGRRTGLRVDRRIQSPMPRLGGEAELVFYRVAQEALTNVARHSGSDRVDLTVESDADRLTLTVRDYGRGLATDGPARAGHGIRGMRERADLIGANLRIGTPSDGPGTELSLELPLDGGPCNA